MILFTLGAPSFAADTDALRQQIDELKQQVEEQSREIEALRSPDRSEPAAQRVGFGQPVRVDVGESVDEVVSFGHPVDVFGHVRGDAVSFGGDVRVGGTGSIDGDAVSFGGRVAVEPGGVVAGNRVAMASSEPVSVALAPDENPAAANLHLSTHPRQLLSAVYHRLVWMLSVAGAGVLVVGLFPQRVSRVARDLEARPIRSAVVGALATGFLVSFAALFAVVTLGLGSPVSLILLLVLGVAWLLGFVGLCQAVGDRLPIQERPHGRWIALLVGVLLISFASSLPWIGWLVVFGTSMVGIGAALSTRFGGVR
ncbi:MAG: hypothetical protein ABMA64_18440 [Myxococcota bacterium]